MRKASSRQKPNRPGLASALVVRLDEESKSYLVQAAALRRVSVADYVWTVTVAQAQQEIRAAQNEDLALTAEEQLAFWKALNKTPRLTAAQRRLGVAMRGES
jgi:uncharacterized protein (DUF1778 family)